MEREIRETVQRNGASAATTCQETPSTPDPAPGRNTLTCPHCNSPVDLAEVLMDYGARLVTQMDRAGNETLKATEKRAITRALAVGHNRKEIARSLGIGRTTLYRRLKEYGIEILVEQPNKDGQDDSSKSHPGGTDALFQQSQ